MTIAPFVAEDAWKPCDLRGSYPDAVSPGLFRDIGGAVGTLLAPSSRVVVAGDFRLSTPELKRAIAVGLVEAGAHVLDVGLVATPVAYFAAQRISAGAALIVTASHNPPSQNGLKLMLGSVPITPRQLSKIRALTEARAFRSGLGAIKSVDPRPAYTRTMQRRWARLRGAEPSRVVLDPGNGAWSETAPGIFRNLGFDVICISCAADGRFPDRPPDCSRASNLVRLCDAVRAMPGSIGIAWDGDGDRAAFVDEDGGYVTPDEIALLFARTVLKSEAPRASRKIVIDLKCSEAVQRAVLEYGGIPLLERTGHAFMRGRMVAEKALLGLDACGHYFFGELHGGDDGLFAALFLLDLVRQSGRQLRALRRDLPRIFSAPEIRIPAGVVSYARASEALASAFPEARTIEIDGLRLVMGDGVVLVRESGTEQVLSLRIEGFSSAGYARILDRCVQSLPEAAPQLHREALQADSL